MCYYNVQEVNDLKKEQCSVRLRRALALRGIKQSELSQRADVPKSAISQYLSGKFEPKQDRIEIFANILDVSEAWLMGYDVPMSRELKTEFILFNFPFKSNT